MWTAHERSGNHRFLPCFFQLMSWTGQGKWSLSTFLKQSSAHAVGCTLQSWCMLEHQVSVRKKLPFILVNETTKQRYTSLVMPFFCMLFKVFENRAELQALKLSDNIRRATRDLYQSLKLRSCVTPFSELHAVLFEALLGNITLEESNSFTYAYLSCICVDAIDSENPRFRLGIEVSPYVSALVYLASCAGLFVLV